MSDEPAVKYEIMCKVDATTAVGLDEINDFMAGCGFHEKIRYRSEEEVPLFVLTAPEPLSDDHLRAILDTIRMTLSKSDLKLDIEVCSARRTVS